MRHYHGTPLGGTRDSVARFIASGNRHFLVPFPRHEDMPIVSESSCGFCLDNGAFSAWKSGHPITDWSPYYEWCLKWSSNPRFDFAIIPDVVDGTEEENNKLFGEWFKRCRLVDNGKFGSGIGFVEGAPVWHMHESLDRLEYLMGHSRIVCIGSSGEWPNPGTTSWHKRMEDAMRILCDDKGHPRIKFHGLRMLNPAIVEMYPFYSADSTNVAQNSQLIRRYGMYCPATVSQRREILASRIESVRSPSAWLGCENDKQQTLTLCET